jgi:hypothetical protein
MRGVARVALLSLLLTLSQVQATAGSLSIFYRLAFLSFDNPATQQHDERATLSAPYADASGETLAYARTAASRAGRFVAVERHARHDTLAASLGITRSPPGA